MLKVFVFFASVFVGTVMLAQERNLETRMSVADSRRASYIEGFPIGYLGESLGVASQEKVCVGGICEGESVYYAPEESQETLFVLRVSPSRRRVYLYETSEARGRVFSTNPVDVLLPYGCGPWWHPTSWCVGDWAYLRDSGGLAVEVVAVNPESDWVLIDIPLLADTRLHYYQASDLKVCRVCALWDVPRRFGP